MNQFQSYPPNTNTTSSFYRSGQQTRQQSPKSIPQLSHSITSQNRQTSQTIDKQLLNLQLKHDSLSKRIIQQTEQHNELQTELSVIQKQTSNKIRDIHKEDITKQWSSEMQKTIESVISSTRQSNQKIFQKGIIDYQAISNFCENVEERIREERKEREREWEQLIDNVGQTIIQAEAVVEADRDDVDKRMNYVEAQVLDMQEQTNIAIQVQRSSRKQQHEYLTKLIERIMDKLIH